MIVISDTTPLITLMKVGHLDLLNNFFGNIHIPEAVYNELTSNPRFHIEAIQIQNCSYISVKTVSDSRTSIDHFCKSTELDIGESEAIILSREMNADLLLIDELKGRQVAEKMGLKIMGTIGLLLAAFEENSISTQEMLESIEILRSSNRHIGEQYFELLLNKISEV